MQLILYFPGIKVIHRWRQWYSLANNKQMPICENISRSTGVAHWLATRSIDAGHPPRNADMHCMEGRMWFHEPPCTFHVLFHGLTTSTIPVYYSMYSFSASCCRLGYEPISGPNSPVCARSTCVTLGAEKVCWAKACLISQCCPWPRRTLPCSLPCTPPCATSWRLPCACSRTIPCTFPCTFPACWLPKALCKYSNIFKSSSGEERQIWECQERRGGRVGHPDQLRVVATQLLTVPPALSWPLNRMLHEGCEYSQTPIKNSTADKCGRTRPRIA